MKSILAFLNRKRLFKRVVPIWAIAIILALAFLGVGCPFASYDVEVPSGYEETCDDWCVRLNGGGWRGGTLTIDVTITNLGQRRGFGIFSPGGGPDLMVEDITGKWLAPQPSGDSLRAPYTKEFYPGESWTGTLVFLLSPYSGKTILSMVEYGAVKCYYMFYLGEPVGSG
jgi:hypothetical protein